MRTSYHADEQARPPVYLCTDPYADSIGAKAELSSSFPSGPTDYLSLTAVANGFSTKRGPVDYAWPAITTAPGADGETLRLRGRFP